MIEISAICIFRGTCCEGAGREDLTQVVCGGPHALTYNELECLLRFSSGTFLFQAFPFEREIVQVAGVCSSSSFL